MEIFEEEYTPDSYRVVHLVDPGEAGQRLDQFLRSKYTKRSREELKRGIADGAIRILRTPLSLQVGKLRASTSVLAGDRIEVESMKRPEPEVNFDYSVLYEDESILIINKPSPLPVHPAGKYFFHTLLTNLRIHGHPSKLPENKNYYLPHRIDKETSGVLLVARSPEICAQLVAQFAEREVKKTYIAVCHGEVPWEERVIHRPLERSKTARLRLKMDEVPLEEGGLQAETAVRVLRRGNGRSLLECRPRTGRQHQIRVHLALEGYPLIGDKIYSLDENETLPYMEPPAKSRLTSTLYKSPFINPWDNENLRLKLVMSRHALHAETLEFHHPKTGACMQFRAEVPPEFERLLL